MAFLAATHNSAWWSVHVWDSDSSSTCDQIISMVLYHGVCSEDTYGDKSTSNCVSFTDTSTWDSFDNFLNGDGTTNTQDADMVTGASHYNTCGKLINAALAFCVIGVVCQLVSGFAVPVDKHKILQLVNSFFVGLSILLIISAIAMSHNDIDNATYWELIFCPAPGANTTYANSYISGPVYGYFLALFALLFQIILMSFLLTPGNCCFCCPCQQCCGCVEYKEPLAFQEQSATPVVAVGAATPTAQSVQQHTVVVGKVVDYA